MKNKLLISLFAIIAIITITGCEKEMNIVITRTYDMIGVKDSQGKEKYDSQYMLFNEDGTFDGEAWMNYQKNRKYTCSKN